MPTATPTAGAGEATVLFRDDFSRDLGWFLGTSSDGVRRATLGGGALNVRLLQPGYSAFQTAPYIPPSQDVNVDVDARTIAGGSGIAFGYTSGSSYSFYQFSVYPALGAAELGRYTVAHCEPGDACGHGRGAEAYATGETPSCARSDRHTQADGSFWQPSRS